MLTRNRDLFGGPLSSHADLQAARVANCNRFASLTSSFRSNTLASPIRTSEAHDGQRIALLPIESQSWHRYALASGMNCRVSENIVSLSISSSYRFVPCLFVGQEVPRRQLLRKEATIVFVVLLHGLVDFSAAFSATRSIFFSFEASKTVSSSSFVVSGFSNCSGILDLLFSGWTLHRSYSGHFCSPPDSLPSFRTSNSQPPRQRSSR
jgi:hypothetical protein